MISSTIGEFMTTFLLTLDLIGTFVFALSGASAAVRHRLDLFGVLVLSFAAATSGGMLRDILIGATPPVALTDVRYLGVTCVAGLMTFYRYEWTNRLRQPVLIFDAAGLALFAVSGTLKALEFGLSSGPAILLGMLTGIGGGMVRDVLVAQAPIVLRSELYAVAALVAAAIIVIGHELALPDVPVILVAASVCFGLRFMAIRYGWRLPTANPRE